MGLEFDPAKNAKNAKERGLPFEMAAELEWQKAIVSIDSRFEYGEERLVAIAPMRGRLNVVCYLFRGRVRRIISLRKANKREERAYAKAATDE